LDYIRRSHLTSGELTHLIETDGLRGVTSNPAIFEKAITGSTDYVEVLQALAPQYREAKSLYEYVAIRDIQDAAKMVSCAMWPAWPAFSLAASIRRSTPGSASGSKPSPGTVSEPCCTAQWARWPSPMPSRRTNSIRRRSVAHVGRPWETSGTSGMVETAADQHVFQIPVYLGGLDPNAARVVAQHQQEIVSFLQGHAVGTAGR
jgi:transaldolase/fructose-6-phosphate aldolase-like protein